MISAVSHQFDPSLRAMRLRFRTGFSLIEVLIAVTVLSTGLLGMLALQLNVMRATQEAHLETVALHLASDMAEQIRTVAASPDARHQWEQFDFDAATAAPAAPAVACFGSKAACTPAQLAAFEIAQWKNRIKQQLPAGRVRACRDATPWQSAVQSASWSCNRQPDAAVWIKVGWRSESVASTAESAPKLILPAGLAHD